MKISRPRRSRKPPAQPPRGPAIIPDAPPAPVADDLGEPEGSVEMDLLPEGWEYLNKEGLQDQCRERNLSDEGYKSELKARLQAWQDKHFPQE